MVAGPERTVSEDETFTAYRPVVKTGSGVGAGVGVPGVVLPLLLLLLLLLLSGCSGSGAGVVSLTVRVALSHPASKPIASAMSAML